MLVVTRKNNEGVVVVNRQTGEVIKIRVLLLTEKIKVGIDAPEKFEIIREELLNRPASQSLK